MSRRVTLRHRIEYAAFVVLRGFLRLLPEAVALGFGEALGWVAGVVFRIRRGVVDDNLARAFPEYGGRWRRRIARGSYRHLGRESVATFRLGRQATAWVRGATEIEGLAPLAASVDAGRGGVVVTGHLGSWEMGGAALAVRALHVDGVALVQGNPLFDRDLTEVRNRLGIEVIRRGDASRAVLRSLRQGRVPALVADQNARKAPLFIEFFGRPAATFRGPALFSLRTGAPLFVGICLRTSRHPQRYRIVLQQVAVEPSGDLDDDVRRLTEAHVGVLESWIRRAPDQYFWQHKRWKTRPPPPVSAPTAPDPETHRGARG